MMQSAKTFSFIILLWLVIMVIFAGCQIQMQEDSSPTENPQTVFEPTNKPTNQPTKSPTPTPSTQPTQEQTPLQSIMPDRQAASLDENIAKQPVLDNGLALIEIASYLNLDTIELGVEYRNAFEYVRGHINASNYFVLGNRDLGLRHVSYNNYEEGTNNIKYIELDKNKVTFAGVNAKMNFEEVQSILGEAKIHVLEDGLPGLFTYELRYKYLDINLRIYSYEKDCKSGINFSIVEDFLPEYRNIRITPEEISRYFELTLLELQEEIDVGEELWRDEEFAQYNLSGVWFRYDSTGQELQSIWFPENYQFLELQKYVSLEEVEWLFGKGKEEEEFDGDSGFTYWVTYNFDNFNLVTVLHPEDGWGIELYVTKD